MVRACVMGVVRVECFGVCVEEGGACVREGTGIWECSATSEAQETQSKLCQRAGACPAHLQQPRLLLEQGVALVLERLRGGKEWRGGGKKGRI
jgi:hypothetical protein